MTVLKSRPHFRCLRPPSTVWRTALDPISPPALIALTPRSRPKSRVGSGTGESLRGHEAESTGALPRRSTAIERLRVGQRKGRRNRETDRGHPSRKAARLVRPTGRVRGSGGRRSALSLRCPQHRRDGLPSLRAPPGAFEPALARNLGALGKIQLGSDPRAATRTLEEGLRLLLPHVRRAAVAFGGLAATMTQYLLEACNQAGTEPNTKLTKELEMLLTPETRKD